MLISRVVFDKQQIVLMGYSGHAYVVADAALLNGFQLAGYLDTEEKEMNPYGIPFLGSEDTIESKQLDKNSLFFPAVGSNALRRKFCAYLKDKNLNEGLLIHPRAVVSAQAALQKSTFVSALAIVQARASIGRGCIINTGAIVEHECIIGDFAHIAPGAVLAGNVTVGNNTIIGAGTIVREGIRIGSGVVIGAGSLVLKDIPDAETWYGHPASRKKA